MICIKNIMTTAALSSLLVLSASFAYGMDRDVFEGKRNPGLQKQVRSPEEEKKCELNLCSAGLKKVNDFLNLMVTNLPLLDPETYVPGNVKLNNGNNQVTLLLQELTKEYAMGLLAWKQLAPQNRMLLEKCEEFSKDPSESFSLKAKESVAIGKQNVEKIETLRRVFEQLFGSAVVMELEAKSSL